MKSNAFRMALLASLAALLFCTGCRMHLGDMSVASTREIPLRQIDFRKVPAGKKAVGKDSRPVFLFIPLGFPDLTKAIDNALEESGGDILTDVVIHAEGWWFLVGQNGIVVEGTALNTKAARP
jgi:hypothetical protein